MLGILLLFKYTTDWSKSCTYCLLTTFICRIKQNALIIFIYINCMVSLFSISVSVMLMVYLEDRYSTCKSTQYQKSIISKWCMHAMCICFVK